MQANVMQQQVIDSDRIRFTVTQRGHTEGYIHCGLQAAINQEDAPTSHTQTMFHHISSILLYLSEHIVKIVTKRLVDTLSLRPNVGPL